MAIDRRAWLTLLVSVACLSAGLPGCAQAAGPSRIRGTINAVDADTLTIATDTGQTLKVTLQPPVKLLALLPAHVGYLQDSLYIGVTTLPRVEGGLRAVEIHIFPPEARGAGEGVQPWDKPAGSSMATGTIDSLRGTGTKVTGDVVVQTGTLTMVVTDKDGQQTVQVPQDTPVTLFAPGDRDLLVPGAHVLLAGAQAGDGSWRSSWIAIGKDGLVPPM